MSEEEHQFCQHAFHGAVVAVHHPRLEELESRSIAMHLHRALVALCDVHHDDAAVDEGTEFVHEPRFLGCIARAEGLENHGAQSSHGEAGVHHLRTDAREERQNHDVVVQQEVRFEDRSRFRAANEVLLIFNMYAGVCQRREVEGAEGVEPLGVDFCCSVSSHQSVFEEDADLGHHGSSAAVGGCCDFDARQKVFLSVGAETPDGELRPRDDDRLSEILQHEAQRTGGVCHCVCAVEEHEAVIVLIVVADDVGNFHPVARLHVRTVNGEVKGECIDVKVEALQFGDIFFELRKLKVLESPGDGVLNHSDGSSGVDEENVRAVVQCGQGLWGGISRGVGLFSSAERRWNREDPP